MGQMSNPDDEVVAEGTEPAHVETEPAAVETEPAAEPAPVETEPAAEPAPVETETAAELESVEPEPTVAAEPTPDMPPHQRFELAADREAAFAAAQAALAEGRCIVLPTDTVYGIAADALNPDAVQGLLDAKGRGRDMPPPVLIAEPAMLRALVAKVPRSVDKIVERYWPGALTVILKAQDSLKMDLGQTHGTIAVRVPDNADTRELLRRTGPLAVSSANLSGHDAATDIEDAIAQLGDRVAVYLDGGPTPGPVPSTIVDYASTIRGRVVRAGLIDYADLVKLAPLLLKLPEPEPVPEPGLEGEAAPETNETPEAEPVPQPGQPTTTDPAATPEEATTPDA